MLALDGLVADLHLLVIATVLVMGTLTGPVLFRQKRVGQYEKVFELLKFRSMRVENAGARVTAKGDARVTRVGRLLRKSKLDELPELWNVARGDISLVGPRPDVPRYVEYLRQRSWRTDLRVLLETLLAVIFPAQAPPPEMDEIIQAVLAE